MKTTEIPRISQESLLMRRMKSTKRKRMGKAQIVEASKKKSVKLPSQYL